MYYRVESVEVYEHDITGYVSDEKDAIVERFWDLTAAEIESVANVHTVNWHDSKSSAVLELKTLSEDAQYTDTVKVGNLYRSVDGEYVHPRYGLVAVWYRIVRD